MATKTGLPTTREEVLEILINRKTPQATTEEGCTYLHEHNGGCAIGQCVSKKTAIRMEGDGNTAVSDTYNQKTLPKRLRELGVDFLEDLQGVHDCDNTWNDHDTALLGEDGLVWSEVGKKEINEIIQDYNLSTPKFNI